MYVKSFGYTQVILLKQLNGESAPFEDFGKCKMNASKYFFSAVSSGSEPVKDH